ncbi:hypothetical protein MKW98_031145 [Papaver atlanticum]|uniref:Uncharacterized protein n=1 Tax=Papaver atlanticum TaxID=357466 RepID=A0AAD4XMR5_9MAGN|nr:hypothetical protein MKW98_031145 [Papaver atlanticum]
MEDDKFATYDADLGDEEWLGKLSDDQYGENSVSLEKFGEIIGAFENAAFYCPNNKINQSRAITLCSGTGTNLVVDVYLYWLKKQKQKRSSQLIVIQVVDQSKNRNNQSKKRKISIEEPRPCEEGKGGGNNEPERLPSSEPMMPAIPMENRIRMA